MEKMMEMSIEECQKKCNEKEMSHAGGKKSMGDMNKEDMGKMD